MKKSSLFIVSGLVVVLTVFSLCNISNTADSTVNSNPKPLKNYLKTRYKVDFMLLKKVEDNKSKKTLCYTACPDNNQKLVFKVYRTTYVPTMFPFLRIPDTYYWDDLEYVIADYIAKKSSSEISQINVNVDSDIPGAAEQIFSIIKDYDKELQHYNIIERPSIHMNISIHNVKRSIEFYHRSYKETCDTLRKELNSA